MAKTRHAFRALPVRFYPAYLIMFVVALSSALKLAVRRFEKMVSLLVSSLLMGRILAAAVKRRLMPHSVVAMVRLEPPRRQRQQHWRQRQQKRHLLGRVDAPKWGAA